MCVRIYGAIFMRSLSTPDVGFCPVIFDPISSLGTKKSLLTRPRVSLAEHGVTARRGVCEPYSITKSRTLSAASFKQSLSKSSSRCSCGFSVRVSQFCFLISIGFVLYCDGTCWIVDHSGLFDLGCFFCD